MLTDFDPTEFNNMSDLELSELINTVEAILIANRLKKEGVFSCGYKIDVDTCKQLKVYANERGIYPTKDPELLTSLVLSIQEASKI